MPLAVAATLAIAAAGLRMVEVSPDAGPAVAPPTMRRVTTTRGQRAEIGLDDGTRVVLGVDSRLEFPSDFGATRRDVYLDGTAYFHVVHDPQRPFAVHTVNAVTRDVGTQFVVRAYPGDLRTEVVVTEGSVAIGAPQSAGEHDTVLTRDERGVLTTGKAGVTVSAVDPAAYTAWMQGELVFRDAPLTAVLRELRRWYETDVELGDASLAALPMSAAFTAESFREAMATLTTVLPVRAVREGKKVVLYRKTAGR
jgi:ferric-dicitrate binding protein FerR (iron transport regulator)